MCNKEIIGIIIQTKSRYQCGLVEVGLKAYFNDKTNWRKMLQNQVEDLDLQSIYQEHRKEISAVVDSVNEKFNDRMNGAVNFILDADIDNSLIYPWAKKNKSAFGDYKKQIVL